MAGGDTVGTAINLHSAVCVSPPPGSPPPCAPALALPSQFPLPPRTGLRPPPESGLSCSRSVRRGERRPVWASEPEVCGSGCGFGSQALLGLWAARREAQRGLCAPRATRFIARETEARPVHRGPRSLRKRRRLRKALSLARQRLQRGDRASLALPRQRSRRRKAGGRQPETGGAPGRETRPNRPTPSSRPLPARVPRWAPLPGCPGRRWSHRAASAGASVASSSYPSCPQLLRILSQIKRLSLGGLSFFPGFPGLRFSLSRGDTYGRAPLPDAAGTGRLLWAGEPRTTPTP